MSLTPAEVNFVEHIVQEKLRYEAIFEEQSKVFQADEAKFKQVIMQFQQSSSHRSLQNPIRSGYPRQIRLTSILHNVITFAVQFHAMMMS